MDRFLYYPLSLMPYLVITLIVSFTIHELAHAYVAYKFGDDTAKREGRLTLNPIKHLDPFGTILILVAGFGWARPIPVNRRFFKKPRLAGVLVSIAGPVSNLILAFVGFFLLVLMHAYGMEMLAAFSTGLDQFFSIWIQLNLVLFLFNLLPLPPLDGYRIIEDLVPSGVRAKMTQAESYGFIVFLVLFVTPLGSYVLWPMLNAGRDSILKLFSAIFQPLL
ncbi:site-2 protease family protein [Bacillus inaquosorum]|uniref:site-2 protease family protein n=1 Tax=Bacillus inaquosorum TaxID=483913 RepID=UPI00227E996E|nr:site-2 protease family protein [Bacillus inaquosorum]MCY8137973.1 site-2 protease family protein [Bacillus inaquosorum]MCY8274042.1 site-2 protease family protein [Bacillus inaquosorum]MCY8388332.1 site-2 protease family protein [Bacillus inaquosorum]MCY8729625.1 site-2 protease family protein [Bacillus inaquosorum]MCY9298192.1 site-2 protease family protein [Bacillus inaquosorum]